METIVTSATKEVIISIDRPTVIIGERINPSGNKKLTEALKNGDLSLVQKMAIQQVETGADIIDVNVGAFGVDDTDLLPEAVKLVMDAVDVPICIDSSNPKAIVAALKVYKGKALVNSTSGEEKSMSVVIPACAEYGAAIVGLVSDDEGVPRDADRRVSIAAKIIDRCEKAGIKREDIVIDGLAFAVGADTTAGPQVLDAITRIREEFGVNQTLGASNVSFGLPGRPQLNAAFLSMVIQNGCTCLITNAKHNRATILATDLILGRDKRARRYMTAIRQMNAAK